MKKAAILAKFRKCNRWFSLNEENKMMYILILFFISISVLSCSIDNSDDNPKYKRVFLNIDAESDSVGFPDSSPEINIGKYGYASFLNPNSNLGLDTVTIPLDGYNSDCSVHLDFFSCHSHSKSCPSEPRSSDTVFINYGESKLTDYLPYRKIPELDTLAIKDLFTTAIVNNDIELSDTVESNYKFSQNGLPSGVDFYDVPTADKAKISGPYTPDNCAILISYPSLSVYAYQLQKRGSAIVPKDTTITWTLIYTDQYGHSDSLEVRTKFR